jgi:hypothetical protein
MPTRAVRTRIHLNEFPHTNGGLDTQAVLTGAWSLFQHKFVATATHDDYRLAFWLADFDQAGDVFEFDDVRLELAVGETHRRERPPVNPGRQGGRQNPGRQGSTRWCWDKVSSETPVLGYRMYASLTQGMEDTILVYEVDASVCEGDTCCGPRDQLPVIFFEVRAYNANGEGL